MTASLFSYQYDLEVRVGLSHLTKTLLNNIYGKAAFDAELEAHMQTHQHVGYFASAHKVEVKSPKRGPFTSFYGHLGTG